MGKGSKQRPLSVSKEKFDENFEKIFGKKEKETTITISVSGTTGQGHTLTVKDLSVTISPK